MDKAKAFCAKCYYYCYAPEMAAELLNEKGKDVEPDGHKAVLERERSTAEDGDEIAKSVNEFSVRLLLQVLKRLEGGVCVAPLSIAMARAMFLIGWESDAECEMQRSLEILGWMRLKHSWTWWPVPVTHVKRAVQVVNHQNNVLKPLGVTYRPNFVRRLDHVFMVVSMISKERFLFKPEVHDVNCTNSEYFLESFNTEIKTKTFGKVPRALFSMDRENRALLFTIDILKARLPTPNGGICRLEEREFELCPAVDSAPICFPSVTSSSSSRPESGAGTGGGLMGRASQLVDKAERLAASVPGTNQAASKVNTRCYVNDHMLLRATNSLIKPLHLVALPIEIESGWPLAMELVLIVPETMDALKDFESMLREKPTQMEKLMDEMEVAESSDVALELPRILFDAVVDFEAPMKAAAVAPQEGSKSADSKEPKDKSQIEYRLRGVHRVLLDVEPPPAGQSELDAASLAMVVKPTPGVTLDRFVVKCLRPFYFVVHSRAMSSPDGKEGETSSKQITYLIGRYSVPPK